MTPNQPAAGEHPGIDLLFRLATSLIFVVAGLGHFFRPGQMVERL